MKNVQTVQISETFQDLLREPSNLSLLEFPVLPEDASKRTWTADEEESQRRS